MNFSYKYLHFFTAVSLVLTAILLCGVLCSCSNIFGSSNNSSSNLSQTEQPTTSTPLKDAISTTYGYDNISNDVSKKLYEQIGSAVQNIQNGKLVYFGSASEKQIFEALSAYKNDHPEDFWINNSYEYYNDGSTTNIEIKYNCYNEELEQKKQTFNTTVDNIIAQAPKSTGEYELELFANNYISDNCVYNKSATQTNEIIGNENDAYGALVDGKAVCEGYSRAFQLLCNKLNVECVSVVGKSDANHQWNCVKLGDDWYQVDVTWNDPDSDDQWAKNDYLNLTDEQMYKTHTTYPLFADTTDEYYSENSDTSYNLFVPKCTSNKYNYYRMTGVVLTDIESSDEVVNALAKAASNNESCINIVIDDSLDFSTTTNSIINDGYFGEWIYSANEINGYSPQLSSTCKVSLKDNISVLTAVLEYE